MHPMLTRAPAKVRTRTIPFARPLIGEAERQAVEEVLKGATLVHGPQVEAFEAEFAAFTGAPHAVAVANCTAAMHMSYLALGLRRGDEVIVPAQTHVATAHAVVAAGGVPVFVDAEPRTGNLDVDQVAAAITARTAGVAVVHFLGIPADMARLQSLAREHHLFVVEDCALALGARLGATHVGLGGDVGCFSFYPVKHITTLEGGMVITRRADVAERVRALRSLGVDRSPRERATPGVYDVPAFGFNYRMNEVQAAIGRAQLKRLPGWLKHRRCLWALWREHLAGQAEVELLGATVDAAGAAAYCAQVLLNGAERPARDRVVMQVAARGIGTSVYYPQPVPAMTYYRREGARGSYVVAQSISDRAIAFPVGPHVEADGVATMANVLLAATVYARSPA